MQHQFYSHPIADTCDSTEYLYHYLHTGSYTILIKGFISEHQRIYTMLRSLIRYPQYYCCYCRRLIYEQPLLLGHQVLCCQFLFGPHRHCVTPSVRSFIQLDLTLMEAAVPPVDLTQILYLHAQIKYLVISIKHKITFQ